MESATDDELIRRSDLGDESAFETLVRNHYQRIYRVSLSSLGNFADAQDVAQEVCEKLWLNLASFKRGTNFHGWLYTITLNTVRSFRRRPDNRRLNTDLDDLAEVLPDGSAIDAERVIVAKDMLARVLTTLSEREREAVLLVYAEGLKHGEAAVVMGCGETTVSGYVHSAKLKLAQPRHAEDGVSA